MLSIRNSMRRRSVMLNERPKEEFKPQRGIPGMVARPASPSVPAGGVVNAPRLKNDPPWTPAPVASARVVPASPVPAVLDELPDTVAVNGIPEPAVSPPLKVQSLSSLFQMPPLRRNPRSLTGDVRMKLVLKVWRWSNAESPRSAEMLNGYCAAPPPTPPTADASSIDLENVYVAYQETPCANRRFNRDEKLFMFELPQEVS